MIFKKSPVLFSKSAFYSKKNLDQDFGDEEE